MSDHESGDDHHNNQALLGRNNAAGSGEEELASKTLQIQSKRFYLDVKQNRRGRFIKLAEVGAGGKKSRLLFAMSTAAEFRDLLTEFSDHYASLGPPNASKIPDDGKLKSEVMSKENRRYYLDLKENQRGRFLRVSMTVPLSRQRAQVAIPAQGMIEIRDSLTDLLNEFGTDDHETHEELPEPQSLKAENKIFYFDIGQNRRGKFMRISEVRTNFRTAITIPERSWARFRDVLSDFADKGASGDSQQQKKDQHPPTAGDAAATATVSAGPAVAAVGASGEKN
ncbi:hypothetical protein HELRODRAFT_186066 [Helobdella robusta]|uniref:Transcriptional activator protein Pur-alpha n=1 Tax=Helobdella robusta TaxID=6412 RepID=T1FNM3_HELRO|nr:hypothetical protein HELRODRAFT_186066 [Helobdella robusta]ESN93899.1 hypothetical protein HELRODRAFT_186066 [Helobdella robusta]